MKYGKLNENRLEYAPNPIIGEHTTVTNPTDVEYRALGFKPVNKVKCPEDGKIYESSWIEDDNIITQVWVEVPEPHYEPTDVEKLRSDVDYIAMCVEVDLDESL